ncbi:hypothetical protein D3C80_1560770 [compost metagenome]
MVANRLRLLVAEQELPQVDLRDQGSKVRGVDDDVQLQLLREVASGERPLVGRNVAPGREHARVDLVVVGDERLAAEAGRRQSGVLQEGGHAGHVHEVVDVAVAERGVVERHRERRRDVRQRLAVRGRIGG